MTDNPTAFWNSIQQKVKEENSSNSEEAAFTFPKEGITFFKLVGGITDTSWFREFEDKYGKPKVAMVVSLWVKEHPKQLKLTALIVPTFIFTDFILPTIIQQPENLLVTDNDEDSHFGMYIEKKGTGSNTRYQVSLHTKNSFKVSAISTSESNEILTKAISLLSGGKEKKQAFAKDEQFSSDGGDEDIDIF